ncbi:MAG: DEAD/DEAH box helicase [Thermoplasmatota archaeon]
MTGKDENEADAVEGLESLSSDVSRFMLRKGIGRASGPQRRALKPILTGDNLLLIAPTGYGKTEAAFAPLLQRILENRTDGISIIYIAPLRALNRDMLERMTRWCEDLGLRIAVRHSDTTQAERNRQARKPPDVLVTTPETLQIMFTGSRLRKGLVNVRHVIVDEIHELYGEERGAQLDFALSRLDHLADKTIQRIGLSATVADPGGVAAFLGGGGRKVKIIEGTWKKDFSFLVDSPAVEDGDREAAREVGCTPKIAAVIRRMHDLILENRSTLVFVNSRDLAEALTTRMRKMHPDLSVGIHHGSLSRETRLEMERDFKSGGIKAMICTSSMELGMDIGAVDLVIQFKSPKEVSRLIQRGGRAGHRIGDVSRCVILATESDDVMESGVIASLALRGKLERRGARKMILSVLANQILSTASAEKIVEVDAFHEIALGTFTFSGIGRDRLLQVLRYLNDSKMIFLDEETGVFKGGKRAREYFYSNISMIPDERIMLIRDISTRSVIGSLDMDFVLSNLEPYSKFIVKGQPWRVLDIRDEEILVEPVTDLGPVPAWSGSDIPVPWEVAREVARIRRDAVSWIEKGGHKPRSLRDIPITEEAEGMIIDRLKEQIEGGFATADIGTGTLEYGMEGSIMGLCAGTRTNETLGRIIAALLSGRYGGTVIVDFDAYRILLQGDLRIKPGDMEWAVNNIPRSDMKRMLPVLIRNSPLLRWQMLHVAKKFGAIGADVDPMHFPLRRIMARWSDSIIMEEALEKIMHERFDLRHTKELLGRIDSGRMELVAQGISPLSVSGSIVKREFMTPENAGREVMEAIRDRLMTTALRLTCMNCGATLRATAERSRTIVGCHRCGSRMLAPLPTGDVRTQKAVRDGLEKKRKLAGDDRKRFKAAVMAAELFSQYGYRAVMCMAARGVGPKTAGRILAAYVESDEELARAIFRDEVKYARTRRFWD